MRLIRRCLRAAAGLLLAIAAASPAHAVLALDGSNNGHNATNSIAVTLTTTSANDVVFAFVAFNVTGCQTTQTGSISDTSALTWHFRGQSRITTGQCIAEYWAVAPSALTGDSITWNSGATSSFNNMTVFGISGANTGSPFDVNASLPSIVITGNALAQFSTTAATTLVIAAGRSLATSAPTTGSGWTGILSGVTGSFALTEYQAFASAQTSVTPTATTGANNFNGAITDAVVPAVASKPGLGLLHVGQ